MSLPVAAPVLTYAAFWHRYLRAHSRRSTRLVHYAGTALALSALLAGLLLDWRWLIVAPLVGWLCLGGALGVGGEPAGNLRPSGWQATPAWPGWR